MKTKQEIAAYMRTYRAKHHEKLIDYHIDWWIDNGEEINRRRRKRYANDPVWREKERQRWRDYVIKKRSQNPEWRRPVKNTPGRPRKETR